MVLFISQIVIATLQQRHFSEDDVIYCHAHVTIVVTPHGRLLFSDGDKVVIFNLWKKAAHVTSKDFSVGHLELFYDTISACINIHKDNFDDLIKVCTKVKIVVMYKTSHDEYIVIKLHYLLANFKNCINCNMNLYITFFGKINIK